MKKKITKKQMSGYLSDSKLHQAILWLLNIPREEMSDQMLLAYKKMQKSQQNEIWLIDYFEQNLKDEINDFIDWNDSMFSAKTSL